RRRAPRARPRTGLRRSSGRSRSVRRLHRKHRMPAAATMTIDLSLSQCEPALESEPPPVPAAALRKRKRPATLVAGMRIGAWRVERELGRGGMAAVYAVVHRRFGKRAALKLAH